jgi:hypothetical protein
MTPRSGAAARTCASTSGACTSGTDTNFRKARAVRRRATTASRVDAARNDPPHSAHPRPRSRVRASPAGARGRAAVAQGRSPPPRRRPAPGRSPGAHRAWRQTAPRPAAGSVRRKTPRGSDDRAIAVMHAAWPLIRSFQRFSTGSTRCAIGIHARPRVPAPGAPRAWDRTSGSSRARGRRGRASSERQHRPGLPWEEARGLAAVAFQRAPL